MIEDDEGSRAGTVLVAVIRNSIFGFLDQLCGTCPLFPRLFSDTNPLVTSQVLGSFLLVAFTAARNS